MRHKINNEMKADTKLDEKDTNKNAEIGRMSYLRMGVIPAASICDPKRAHAEARVQLFRRRVRPPTRTT
jgi:hypothetical protein